MPDSNTVDPALIQQFISENHDVKSISEKLVSLGWDEESVLKYIAAFKKAKNARRHTNGLIYLIIGGFLGFVSCVLAITNPLPEMHNYFLYGITSLAILFGFYGLYNIFE